MAETDLLALRQTGQLAAKSSWKHTMAKAHAVRWRSCTGPLGPTNAEYLTPDTGGVCARPMTQASTASRPRSDGVALPHDRNLRPTMPPAP
jgi:hypothetical protein